MESLANRAATEPVEPSYLALDDPPRTYEGRVVDGSREGPFRFYYRTGKLMAECVYSGGLKDGPFAFYLPSGALERSGEYRSGRFSGLIVHYHENGRPADERRYSDGLLHGPRKTFYPDGQLECEEHHENGRLEGRRAVYSATGRCIREESYTGGKKHGEAKSFSQSGQLIVLERFENGLLEGDREQYFEDGKPYIKSQYLRGKLHGIVQRFDEKGALVENAIFRRGQMMKVPAPEAEPPAEQKKKTKPVKKSDPRLLLEHPADLALAAQNTGMAYVELFAKTGTKLFIFLILPAYLLVLIGQSVMEKVNDRTKERLKLAFEYYQRGETEKAMEGFKIALRSAGEPEPKHDSFHAAGPRPMKRVPKSDFDVKPTPAAPPPLPAAAAPPREASKQPAPAMDVIPVLGKGNSSSNSGGDRLARIVEGQPAANVPMQIAPAAPPPEARQAAAPQADLARGPSISAVSPRGGPEPAKKVPPAPQAPLPSPALDARAREAYMSAAGHLRNGSPSAAVDALSEGIEARPDFAEAHVLLALAQARLGKTIESFRAVRRAVTLEPGYDLANGALGAILLAVGREQQASAYLEKAKALNPDLAEPRALLGVALMRMGNWDDARTELEAAVRLNHQNGVAWAALSVIHWRDSRTALATSELTRALSVDPETAKLGLWDLYSPIKRDRWSREAALAAYKTLLGSNLAAGIDAMEKSAVPAPCKENECFD